MWNNVSICFHFFIQGKVQFGVAVEKLEILQNLSPVVLETIKLNLLTGVLIVVGDVFRLLHFYYYKECNVNVMHAMHAFYCLYFSSNPIVYMTVMRDLRKCYLDLFCVRRRGSFQREVTHWQFVVKAFIKWFLSRKSWRLEYLIIRN